VDLFNEVKLDFSGAAALANSMRSAYQDTSRMRREIQLLQRDSQVVAKNLALARMPGLPNQAGRLAVQNTQSAQAGMTTAQKAALFGTAAAGSSFFFRATSLANPAAMSRFTMAVDDATAVVGQRMIPALEQATRLIRRFGDFLANHPTLTTGIGYGAAGLGLVAAAGAAYQGLKFVGSGLRGIGSQARSFLGYGSAAVGDLAAGVGAATGPAAAAGANRPAESTRAQLARTQTAEMTAQRAASAQAYTQSYHAERRAMSSLEAARAAEMASGGLGAGPETTQARQQAERELEDIRAARTRTASGPPALPGERARPGGLTPPPLPRERPRSSLGQVGQALPLVGIPLMIGGAVQESDPDPNSFLGRGKAGWRMTPSGFLYRGFDYLASGGKSSSYGAAARPAEYQDVLGSFLSMRQSIASGSAMTKADDSTDATENLTTAIQDLSRQIAALNGDASDRGTRSR
jgi:hypothetical protein